jgi:predicted dehydrogenase
LFRQLPNHLRREVASDIPPNVLPPAGISNLNCAVVHENFRFQPWHREIKGLLEAGTVGTRLHSLTFRSRPGDGWGPGAYLNRQPYFRTMPRLLLHETGVPFIDTFRYLAGEQAVRRAFSRAATASRSAALSRRTAWSRAARASRVVRFCRSQCRLRRYTNGYLEATCVKSV